MIKKHILVFSVGAMLFTFCRNGNQGNSQLQELKARKQVTDSLIHVKGLNVLVKVKDQDKLVPVEGKKFPANIETTYNVLKDDQGRILYVGEMPFSATQDWFIVYKSYYGTDGKLFAFQRLNNFLHSRCAPGAAMEDLTEYFDAKFNVIDSTYTLKDTYGKALQRDSCTFPYNFPYRLHHSTDDWQALKNKR
ncbi:hypothetical protein FW774_06230 [Pedobacter sp. BS3]|uniref:hypothetical protein n=1 Tax=Pedobacter sp. BS3 TaxID=2567937 RepID=UPI0011EE714A|nr:hypothetical protein [Pedobacter sp. BS3]TZF84581.1 hypothetical protein FW774_06230 [Pedobacter sp. BS3]